MTTTTASGTDSPDLNDQCLSSHFLLPAIAFPAEYKVEACLRPDIVAEAIRVKKFQRLTPELYDRNIFHLEFDLTDTRTIKHYVMGDALAIYPLNPSSTVETFIRTVLLPDAGWKTMEDIKTQTVELPVELSPASNTGATSNTDAAAHKRLFQSDFIETTSIRCWTTIERALTSILDINGNASKEFFKSLSLYATDILEKVRLAELTLERLQEEFSELVVNGAVTYTTVLRAFPSARPPFRVLAELIPPIKPRVYSIASSSMLCPNQVDLLVVVESWTHKVVTEKNLNSISTSTSCDKTVLRMGLCSDYLSKLRVGDSVMAALTSSTMVLPPSHSTPVVMAGLGTGMAPFRAFLQEKLFFQRQGVSVGPVALYFGSRHKSMEYLYGEELEGMVADGVLSRLNCAFSRDQPNKIYIQHRMQEDASQLAKWLLELKGHFYLCGPTWPAEAVKEALIAAFMEHGGISAREEAEEILRIMKEESRYVLEVY